MGMQILGGRIKHGGAMDNRGIDEPFLRLGVTASCHQRGFCLQRI